MHIRFEWDETKAASNLRKHGVAFEDALRIFEDLNVLMEPDRVVDGELRWRSIGVVNGTLLLLVAHTIRDESDDDNETEVFRLISARAAEWKESRCYGQNRSL